LAARSRPRPKPEALGFKARLALRPMTKPKILSLRPRIRAKISLHSPDIICLEIIDYCYA